MDEKPAEQLCVEAIATCCCLGIHALGFAVMLIYVPEVFDGIMNLLLMLSTALGFGCGLSALRQKGSGNRAVGCLGMLYFGFIVGFAAVTAFSQ